MIPAIDNILDIGGKVIDRLWPDPAQRDKAKLELLRLKQDGAFREDENRYNAIIAEAKSSDPWTSRARPSFLYVFYALILAGPLMGILSAFRPEVAAQIITGMQMWLNAMPDWLYGSFTAGYLGYAGARSYDKKKRLEVK